jgi:hypothetical protein
LDTGFLNVPWLVWSGLALVVALIFAVFIPGRKKIKPMQGFGYVIVRWFHSLVWVLLAISFMMRAIPNEAINGLANFVALLGGITYAIYIITFVRSVSA